jgi:hypothetical protein
VGFLSVPGSIGAAAGRPRIEEGSLKLNQQQIFEGFADHTEFCRQCLTVETLEGRVVPLELGPAQERLNALVRQQRERSKPVRIIVLKARRVQISTAAAAQNFHGTPFRSGQHCAVIAHDWDTAENLSKMYQRFERDYKPFGGVIRLPDRANKADEQPEWTNGSWIKIATARNANFGRSFNIRRLQLDEFAFYDNPRALMTSLMAAVPKDPDTMVIIPSTANGIGNEFHRLWLEASDPQSGSEWVPMFFAWWEHPSNRMKLDIPPDRFQGSLSREEREMMGRYNLTLEQLRWRRWVIKNDLGGSEARFRQEHPGCPEEAFVASGRLYFDVASIGRMPVQRDITTGGLEEYTFGIEKRYSFMPREKGELAVFKRPAEGRSYIAGLDASEGKDANEGEGEANSDFGVCSVFDRDTGEQVAILRCRMEPPPFGAYVYALLRWYNDAALVPEANGPGLWCITEITKRGYPSALIYHRDQQPDEDPAQRTDLIGYKTTVVTRPILLSKLDQALRQMAIALHDPICIQELMTFLIRPNGRAEASSGNHDDTVIANALAVVGMERMPRLNQMRIGGDTRAIAKKYGMERPDDERGKVVRLR